MRRRLTWSAAVPVAAMIVGVAAYSIVYSRYRGDTPVHSDGEGYYAYLPAYLLHLDASLRSVVQGHIQPVYGAHYLASQFGFIAEPNGSYLDKYGLGVAFLLLPFFGIAHGVAIAAGVPHADGYSNIETFLVGLGAVAYAALGLLALRAVLRRWFSEAVTVATLIVTMLGTGLLSYFTWDPTFSHVYSFFAVAVSLLAMVRWLEQPGSWRRAGLLGLAAGLVVAVRLTNAVVLVALPLLGVGSLPALHSRIRLLRSQFPRVMVAVACGALLLVPQLLAWRAATGHWLTRPYPGEPFYFAHPHLLESLTWLQPHGLLPYAPAVGLSVLGLGVAWRRRRDLAVPLTLALLPFWYLTSAWWNWSFTAGYGDRAYIDVVPMFAIGLACLFAALRRTRTRAMVAVVSAAACAVTSMLVLAYWQGRLPGAGIDASGYAQLLLHPLRLLGPPVA